MECNVNRMHLGCPGFLLHDGPVWDADCKDSLMDTIGYVVGELWSIMCCCGGSPGGVAWFERFLEVCVGMGT